MAEIENLPFSLMRLARKMGMSENELATITGMSRSGVHAVCAGLYAEHLTDEAKHNLLMYARLVRDTAIDTVEAMEMMA